MTPTPTPRAGTFVNEQGIPISVRQGPEWLARLIYAPPPWVEPTLSAIAVAVIVLAGLAIYRRGVTREQMRLALRNGTFAVSVAFGTGQIAPYVNGYLMTILGGLMFGTALTVGIGAATMWYRRPIELLLDAERADAE